MSLFHSFQLNRTQEVPTMMPGTNDIHAENRALIPQLLPTSGNKGLVHTWCREGGTWEMEVYVLHSLTNLV